MIDSFLSGRSAKRGYSHSRFTILIPIPIWSQIQQVDVQRLFTLTSACLGTNNRASDAIARSLLFLRPVHHRPVSQARMHPTYSLRALFVDVPYYIHIWRSPPSSGSYLGPYRISRESCSPISVAPTTGLSLNLH